MGGGGSWMYVFQMWLLLIGHESESKILPLVNSPDQLLLVADHINLGLARSFCYFVADFVLKSTVLEDAQRNFP